MIGTFHRRMKKGVLFAALAAAASVVGAARADDSSMNPLTGESYAAFNGGDNPPAISNPTFDNAPSAWRNANPSGLPERVFQSYSAPGEAWHLNAPTYASAAAVQEFRQSHPAGLSEQEFQALSSEGSAWQLRGEPGTAALGSEQQPELAQATSEPLGTRIARLFHRNTTLTQ